MNLKLLTVVFFAVNLIACQAATDPSSEAAEVAIKAPASSGALANTNGGPQGKGGVATKDVLADSALPLDPAACAQLAQKTFQSVAEYEMGRSRTGIIKGHWVIGFDQSQFRWRYSDVVEMGDYQCVDGRITFMTALGEPRASGSFNSELGKLIVDGIEYALQP